MNVEILQGMLGWCAIINYSILVYWFLWISLADDWVYGMQTRFMKIDRARFDLVHYVGISFFKVFIFVFNIVPYIALRIVVD